MSFRLFIYYCAVCGGWAAFVGWLLGKWLAPEAVLERAAILGTWLGLCVAFALSLVDFLGSYSVRAWSRLAQSVAAATAIGALGGCLGGFLGQVLVNLFNWSGFIVGGWTLTGTLIGASIGCLETLRTWLHGESFASASRKMRNGVLGGFLGGLLGSILYLVLRTLLSRALAKPADELLSSSAVGFVALGACIGLLIGLAQVVLKEAWIKVVAGFRPGRELILTKPVTIIGKGEASDVGLYGGVGVEKAHARILRQGQRYVLADLESATGTFLNEHALVGQEALAHGDRIRVGDCVLLFQERRSARSART